MAQDTGNLRQTMENVGSCFPRSDVQIGASTQVSRTRVVVRLHLLTSGRDSRASVPTDQNAGRAGRARTGQTGGRAAGPRQGGVPPPSAVSPASRAATPGPAQATGRCGVTTT